MVRGSPLRFRWWRRVRAARRWGPISPQPIRRRTDGEQQRILAVDDDPRTLRYIRDVLSKAGYAPIVTGDPHEVFSLMEASDPQLVLLDLMLPGTDGIKLMQEILEMADVPVIFLSAYGQEEYVTRAFDLGAVDYIVKPFAPMELAARIRAALRKSWSVQQSAEPYLLRDLTIDYAQRSVTVAGRPVELDPHRVPTAIRALSERRSCIDPRLLAETNLGTGILRLLTTRTLLRQEASSQTGRRPEEPDVHLYAASCGVPHGEGLLIWGGDRVTAPVFIEAQPQ